jgi:hypothetical protein
LRLLLLLRLTLLQSLARLPVLHCQVVLLHQVCYQLVLPSHYPILCFNFVQLVRRLFGQLHVRLLEISVHLPDLCMQVLNLVVLLYL